MCLHLAAMLVRVYEYMCMGGDAIWCDKFDQKNERYFKYCINLFFV